MLTALPGFMPVIALICALSFMLDAGRGRLPDGDQAEPPCFPVAATAYVASDVQQFLGDRSSRLAPQPAPGVSPLLPPVTPHSSTGPGSGNPGPASESTHPGVPLRPSGYRRSLIFSGLLGLLISATGIVMVSRRRRLW